MGAAAERGEWFCAEAASRELCEMGDFERAWVVVAPFAATGWRLALTPGAEVCFRWGRAEEALDLVRQGAAASEVWELRDLARVLVRAGRVDEAIEMLAPHLADTALQSALVGMTEGQGRDERVLELLAPLAEQARRIAGEGRWDVHVSLAQKFQAQVLERAGRAGEAITVLGADIAAGRYVALNTLEFYAGLLRRHGRFEELRVLATGDHAADTLGDYTQALEEHGRAREAEAVLRRHLDTTGHPAHRGALVALLSRQGRIDEAVEAARPAFEDPGCGNLLDAVARLLVEGGRPERALELLDERSENYIEEHPQSARSMRLWLLAEAGRHQEAPGTGHGPHARRIRRPGPHHLLAARTTRPRGRGHRPAPVLRRRRSAPAAGGTPDQTGEARRGNRALSPRGHYPDGGDTPPGSRSPRHRPRPSVLTPARDEPDGAPHGPSAPADLRVAVMGPAPPRMWGCPAPRTVASADGRAGPVVGMAAVSPWPARVARVL